MCAEPIINAALARSLASNSQMRVKSGEGTALASLHGIIAGPGSILNELVGGITSKNRHRERAWGNPAGKEVW